jgi:type IV pilus assembly protein PilE
MHVKNGFTLIELVVVMLIVAVLAAIAIPSYQAYTRKANRSDATRAMTLDAQALERCYSQNFTYTTGCSVPAGPLASPQGYYTLTVVTTASTYTVTATASATGPQASDSQCQTFTVDNTGAQGASPGTAQTCWGST